MSTPTIPRVITHKNMEPLLRALEREPCFQPGKAPPCPPDAWFYRDVTLEVPTGELARGGLSTFALTGGGRRQRVHGELTGKEGFDAQGLEGKVSICKDLFSALMNLRDIVPVHRGRIVVRGGACDPSPGRTARR